eukprot:9628150-Heterocapsa_arctica.AAC.1
MVASVCRVKGQADTASVRACNRFLTEAGLNGTIRMRSDPEMAARAAAQAVATRRSPARTVLETSPKKSSGSLGV